MDNNRTYGMHAFSVQGQCSEGMELHRKINAIVDIDSGVDYAIGILIDSKNDGHNLRGSIGAEILYEILQAPFISTQYCAKDLIEDYGELKALAKYIQDYWHTKVEGHFDRHPLEACETDMLSNDECDYVNKHPAYLYKCTATIVVENMDGAAIIHVGNSHPLFIYESSFAPMIHQQDPNGCLGDKNLYFETIQLSRPRIIALINDSLYRAMPADYLSNIHKLIGCCPELAEQYIQSQMPLLSEKVNNEDLGIVVLFDRDPLAQKRNLANLNIEEL